MLHTWTPRPSPAKTSASHSEASETDGLSGTSTRSQVPRELSLEPETIYGLSDADSSLGHLQGLGRLLKDPDLLVGPYLTREALASSRIEGTEASLSEVLQAEVSGVEQQSDDIDEVTRFLSATRLGLRLLKICRLLNV